MNNSQSDQPKPQDKGDILIVDDALPNLRILSGMLTEQGYEVRGAPNGSTALMMANAEPPDLILLDIIMPGMDGYEVCRQLKSQAQTRDIPVIFVSGLDEVVNKVKGFAVGGVDYITKPFQIEEVLARVETQVALRRLQKRLKAQNTQLEQEIAERKRAEKALRQVNDELEQRVEQRAARLARANAGLQAEIAERRRAEEDRRQLEAQYHQAQKMAAIGLLAGGIAHDFNNLLTAINGFAELMQRQLQPDDPFREMADSILRSGRRAADLVRQLLIFSCKQITEPQLLDLNHVVGEMEKMLRRIIGEDVQIETDLASDLWSIKADPTQMEQVIVNLAVNARDAMPDGGRLTIETTNIVIDDDYALRHLEMLPGEYALLAISDTGHGMSEEVKSRIFEPFFSTKEAGKGTGLGLATVFGIVEQNDGHIWVYSEPGQGTTFKIYLPRTREAMTASTRREEGNELPRGTETILLVEDDQAVRDLAGRVLRLQGYTVLEAINGEEALRLSREHRGEIQLLLTDVVMPEMGGKALADRLKALRPKTKVLFTSGYTDKAIVHNGVLEPDIAFIPKPFLPGKLVRKVRQVLDS